MAGFHLTGDPYFPNQGNDGWLEAEPEENHEIPLEDIFAEEFPKEADSKPEVKNLPQVAPISNPNHRIDFQGPMSTWVGSLNRLSHEQV